MGLSVFSRLLLTERLRKRASGTGFSTPVLHEFEEPPEAEPLLVTNTRGTFVQTKRSQEGLVRCGFSEVPLEQEGALFNELYLTLCKTATQLGWPPVCTSVTAAIETLESAGGRACSIVVPYAFAQELCGLAEDVVRERMAKLGAVAQVGRSQVLALDLPEDGGVVMDVPSKLGIYVRVDDALGLAIRNLRQTLVLVRRVDD